MKPRQRALFMIAGLGLMVLAGYQHSPPEPIDSRFIKIDSEGHIIAHWQGPWACILDRESGLVWENKTDNESIHEGQWTYSWFIANTGEANNGDCFFEKDRCDTSDLIRRANQEGICGITDWRLPTARELRSIVNRSPKTGQALIFNDFFPFTKRGDYWTSDNNVALTGVYAHLRSGALAIDFITGEPRAIPYRNAAFVRLVSSRNAVQHD